MPEWFFVVAMTLYGLLFGSFANVVIWRVPRSESIVSPGSRCPSCATPIAWYDNVPLASWLVLRGRCRACAVPIAPRYPLVETLSGLLFLMAALRFGPGGRAVVAAFAFWFLLVLSAIDLDHLRLPNPLVGAFAMLALGGALVSQFTGVPLVPLTTGDTVAAAGPLLMAVAGMVIGAGLSAGTAALYAAIRRRKGLGMGDIKLLGALGLLLGPYVVMSLFFGSLIGMVVGLASGRSARLSERRIPFGPWLAAGAAITGLYGPGILQWYLRMTGVL